MYGLCVLTGDVYRPSVALSQFQQDNENIVDEDIVSWITLGVNHVPTAEDVPVTTTGQYIYIIILSFLDLVIGILV